MTQPDTDRPQRMSEDVAAAFALLHSKFGYDESAPTDALCFLQSHIAQLQEVIAMREGEVDVAQEAAMPHNWTWSNSTILQLQAEADTLRAENARLREVVEAAEVTSRQWWGSGSINTNDANKLRHALANLKTEEEA